MTDGHTSIEQHLEASRAALRNLLERIPEDLPIPPQMRANIVQLQADIVADKEGLRRSGSAVADAPEDTAGLPEVPVSVVNRAGNQGAQGVFYGPIAITVVNGEEHEAAGPDPYAQYRAYLLRLLPPLDAGAPPYLGLQTFQFEHADRFFGRDALVAELAERLRRASFLAVLGASGSGKSSVIRAGLLPLLKAGGLPGSQGWHYVTLRPGARPLNALAAALNEVRGGTTADGLALLGQLAEANALLAVADMLRTRLVLFVDQAEELWTLQPADPAQHTPWQAQQRPFLRLLLGALDAPDRPLLVILALRADFLHRAADDPAFARALTDHDIMVGPMSEIELRAAIERPGLQAGGSFEPGLIEELIAQSHSEPGALPLLEYTLQELWAQRQNGRLMSWASYRALGGVEGALAKRADSLLQQHYSPGQQDDLRRVLLRLIQPGEGVADTRRHMTLANLASAGQTSEDVQVLLQPLIDARLLTSGQDQGQQATVEISHEALIRSWPTLRSWLDEARSDLRLQIQLEEAAKEWLASAEDTSLLWDGLKLSNTEAWIQRAHPRLSAHDAAFLETSRAEARRQADAVVQSELNRQHLIVERRNAHLLQMLLALIGGLLLMAIIAIAAAVNSQRQLVAANELINTQRLAYAAQGQRSTDAELALLLAAEAATRSQDLITEQTLRDALSQYPARSRLLARPDFSKNAQFSPDGTHMLGFANDHAWVWKLNDTPSILLNGHTSEVLSAQFSPDGLRIVTTSQDHTARVWTRDGTCVAILKGHTQAVQSAQFSSDGAHIVTVSWDDTARVWTPDGTLISTLQGRAEAVESAYFSPDSTHIVTTSRDGIVRVWSLEGTLVASLQNHSGRVQSARFSPGNTRILTLSTDGTVQVWKLDGSPSVTLQTYGAPAVSAEFSPDDVHIVTIAGEEAALRGGTVQVWKFDGTLVATLQNHNAQMLSAHFSPDGTHIATVSGEGAAQVWKLDGTLMTTLQGHTAPVVSVEFSPDSTRIVTASQDHTARVWELDGTPVATLQGHRRGVRRAQFSPDGTRIFTAALDDTARVWSLENSVFATLQGHSAQFSPDGTRIVTSSVDGTAQVWNLEGKPLATLRGHTGPVVSAQFSPDSSYVVTASKDSTARVWRRNGTPVTTLQGHSDEVSSAQFSPDSAYIVTASRDGTARIWNLGGTLIAALEGHSGEVRSAQFSPDGTHIVTVSEDNTARVWRSNGLFLTTLKGHGSDVRSAQFSPDSTRILTASYDGTARLWALDGRTLVIFKSNANSKVESAQFSPDGAHILTVWVAAQVWKQDGTLLTTLKDSTTVERARFNHNGAQIVTVSGLGSVDVWSLDGTLLTLPQKHTTLVQSAQFSPDDARIAVSSGEGTTRVYLWSFKALQVEAACRLPRGLTPAEVERFEVGAPRFDKSTYQCQR